MIPPLLCGPASIARFLLPLLALCLCLSACKSEKPRPRITPPGERPTLTFYRIPDCFLCEDLQKQLDKDQDQHHARMIFHAVDYHLPTSQEAIRKANLGSHGIVIRDANHQILFNLPAHQPDEAQTLSETIDRLLTPAPPSPSEPR